MPGPEQGFDGRDLASATVDSRGHLLAFLGDLVERATVAIQGRFAAGDALPAFDYDVHVLRIEFDAPADAFGDFGGGERGATAEEWFVHAHRAWCDSAAGGASILWAFGLGGRTSARPIRP